MNGKLIPTNNDRLQTKQTKKKDTRTFLRTAIGKASNSSSVVVHPVISFIFFL